MRFQHLTLAPYGAFAALALDFPQGDSDLQVIYGPNEAGKSTLLRAIEGFLYGIPARTNDGYRYDNKNLQIGARLVLLDGGTVGAIRRKGNKDTLLPWDDGGVRLVESHLQDLLMQISTREQYLHLFGLTHAQMTEGSEVLLQTAGDLGINLASAGLGGRIREVQQSLQVDCEELFKKGGSKQRLPRLSRELEGLKQELDAATIDARAWQQFESAEKDAKARRDALGDQLRELRIREAALKLRLNVMPLLQDLGELEHELAALQEVPLLAPGFAAERVSVEKDIGNPESQLAALAESLARMEQQLLGLPVAFPLLAGEFPIRIEACYERLGVYQDRVEDRPKRQADLVAIEQRLAALRGRLPDSLRAGKHAPDVAQQAQLEKLIDEEARLESTLATAQATLERSQRDEADAQHVLESMGEVSDLSALAESLRQSDEARDLQLHVNQRRETIGDLREGWELPYQRLGYTTESIETFVTRALPLEASIAEAQRTRRELADEQRDLERKLDELSEELAKQESAFASLLRTGRIPSLDELEAVRAHRDAGWSQVKAVWLLGADRLEAEAAWSEGVPLPEAYEAAVLAADQTADDLRAAAEYVEQRRLLEDQLEEKRAGRQVLLDRQQRWAVEQEQWSATWHALWEPLGIAPGSPEEMLEWRRSARAIQEKWQQWQRVSTEIGESLQVIETQRDLLAASVRAAGGRVGEADNLKDIRTEAERLLKEARDIATRLEERRDQLERARRDRMQATEQQQRAASERVRWQESWDALLTRLGLEPGESTSGVRAILRCFQEIATEEAGEQMMIGRVEGIERDIRDLESTFDALLHDLGQAARTQPVDISSTALLGELQRERADFAKREKLLEERADAEEERAAAQRRLQQANDALDRLLAAAQVATVGELPAREEASARRRELESQRDEARRQLQRIGEGRAIEELQLLCANRDLATLTFELEELADERDRLDGERGNAIKAAESARKDREHLEAQVGAVDLSAKEARLRAEMRDAAGDYLRLRLAAELLESGLEAMRQSGDSPVLRRASHWFARLTNNEFCGIALEGSGERQDLRGIRSIDPEARLSPEQMSDGTRDQLYLALRLAIVEQYCLTHEPLPMILDDLLITFDDARTAATLRALAEFSEVTQVLLFTHHRSVCETAESLGLASTIEVATLSA